MGNLVGVVIQEQVNRPQVSIVWLKLAYAGYTTISKYHMYQGKSVSPVSQLVTQWIE